MAKRAIVQTVLDAARWIVTGLVVLAVVAGFAAGIAWWAGFFGEKIEPGRRPVAMRPEIDPADYLIDQVHEVQKTYVVEAVGTLKAESRTEISARVMAEIDKINVGAGDVVPEGKVLVELDRERLRRQISQAEANLAAAKAAVEQAADDLERAHQTRRINARAITDQQLNQLNYQWKAAQARQKAAEEAVAEANVMLDYTEIRAPKSGTVVDRLAEPGDTAQPGVPLLVLYDPTSLRLEVPVMEHLAVKLHVGDKLDVHIDALDRKFPATIDEIVPQAEAASRSFLVKVKLPASPDLFEGMYGRLEIPAGVRRHLCLATAAIQSVGQLDFVQVVDAQGEHPERRFIKVGRLGMPGRVEVLSGLEAGEHVLVKRTRPDDAPPPAPEGTSRSEPDSEPPLEPQG